MSEDLNNNQVRYWIGGYLWDGNPQYDRFIKDRIWENGYGTIPGTKGNIVKKGDYIALKGDDFIRAIGKVIEDAKDKTVKVDWFIRDEQIKYGQGFQSTFAELANDTNARRTVIDRIKQYEEKKMALVNDCKKLLEHSRNIILHGAPGTGKTYLARQIAESMGAETCFVQFHPSYDYTDFVEGLRPAKDSDNKNIYFEKTDGIFKNLCIKALENALSPKKDNFDEIYKKLIDMIIESEEPLILETLSKKKPFSLEVNSKNNIYAIPQTETKTKMSISQEILKEYLRTGKILDWKPYLTVLGQKMLDLGYKKGFDEVEKKNFVIIIDEINRGEMSKIFGELFFSIDPDYRVSKQDIDNHIKGNGKLTVITTQYSSMEPSPNVFDIALEHDNDGDYGHFFVPENVYIIGTMNDIDRNVESMDFAIRRRFAFKEITAADTQDMLDNHNWGENKPDIEAMKNRMDNLNNAISGIEGLSSAYHIGAAYFLKYDSSKDEATAFDELWNYHLKPLLQEYLRGMDGAEQKLEELKKTYDNDK